MSDDTTITPELLDRLARISSGTLTTELFKRGFKQCFLIGPKRINPHTKPFAGEAFTMRFIPAREDKETLATLKPFPTDDNLQWVGVEKIGAGQVLVIDSRNDVRAASMGNMLLTRMMVKGVAAVITDGSFRDGAEIATLDMPAFATDVVASTRLSYHHVADLEVPIACAGVAVYPGDIIVGDADGVTVVPRHVAPDIIDDCEKRDRLEAYLAERVKTGEALWGVYPPTDATRADYQAWVAAGSKVEEIERIRAKDAAE